MTHRICAAMALAVLCGGAQALAHHSFAATYMEDQSITIEGELVQFQYRNPHSFLHLVVKEKNGREVRYSAEWGGAEELDGYGVTRETLKPGDRVVITGSPGRNPEDHRVRILSLRRPRDGFGWYRQGDIMD